MTHTPHILGFCGYARSGKDALADLLPRFFKMGFADALKSDLKRLPSEFENLPKALRRPTMIAYGEAMRQVHPDYWIKRLEQRLARLEGHAGPWVSIIDVRYPNECAWVLAHGGAVIRLHRSGVEAAAETERLSILAIDAAYPNLEHVENDGTPEAAALKVKMLVANLWPEYAKEEVAA